MDNRFELTGVVIEVGEVKVLTQDFSKTEFKIRYTDTDFKNKIKENKVLLNIQNEDIENLPKIMIDDTIRVKFYIDGRDFNKKDGSGIMNFTTLVCFDIEILSSPSRDTDKDRNAVITKEGKVYKDPLVAATMEELAGLVVKKEEKVDDGLLAAWDAKKDKYGLNEDVKGTDPGMENMKSKILNKEDDPFADLEEKLPEGIDKLPF
jgi:hypothetical protein